MERRIDTRIVGSQIEAAPLHVAMGETPDDT